MTTKPRATQSPKYRAQFDSKIDNKLPYKNNSGLRSREIESTFDRMVNEDEKKISYSFNGPKPKVTAGSVPFDRLNSSKEAESPWHHALGNRAGKDSTGLTEEKMNEENFIKRQKLVQGAPLKSAISVFSDLRLKSQKEVIQERHTAAAEQYRQKISERKAKMEEEMNSWQAELEATESKAKSKSQKLLKQMKVDNRFPTSWSRYSSHDRTERLMRSLSIEQIKVRDFANLGYKDNEIIWCLAHNADGHKTELDETSQKNKFKQRVENSAVVFLYKIKVFDVQKQAARARGRRGSLSVAGEMEYPELELLPISLMTDIEIANEVQEDERKRLEKELEKIKEIMVEKVKKEREIEEKTLESEGHISRHNSFSEGLLYPDVVDVMADVIVDNVVAVEPITTMPIIHSIPNGSDVLNGEITPNLFSTKE
ncbi:hypothetical protein HI914_03589 [Erysiphe necator]|uniref:Uncharacterized protein n=1 Tax=Uncinula necator TaxID=52586 RepID=A0A0B1P754_UNCNE|nr:hypothetical protein HI914_03589 [Erysiphe necator]KHJ34093.1 hypothetical protein EV44_g3467 [Erysiphe necator]